MPRFVLDMSAQFSGTVWASDGPQNAPVTVTSRRTVTRLGGTAQGDQQNHLRAGVLTPLVWAKVSTPNTMGILYVGLV